MKTLKHGFNMEARPHHNFLNIQKHKKALLKKESFQPNIFYHKWAKLKNLKYRNHQGTPVGRPGPGLGSGIRGGVRKTSLSVGERPAGGSVRGWGCISVTGLVDVGKLERTSFLGCGSAFCSTAPSPSPPTHTKVVEPSVLTVGLCTSKDSEIIFCKIFQN